MAKKYKVKLAKNHLAKPNQNCNGYLGYSAHGNNQIAIYSRGEAIKKAKMFIGKIEPVQDDELPPLNNTARIERAKRTLKFYTKDKGEHYNENEIDSSDPVDLITDMLHLVAALDQGDNPIDSTLRLAKMHFDAEFNNPEEA